MSSLWAPGVEEVTAQRSRENSAGTSGAATRRASDRLHVAMVITLAAIMLLFAAVHLARSGEGASAEVSSSPVLVVSDGFSATLRTQAQTVVSALAGAGPVATPEAPVLSQSLDSFPGATLVPRPLLTAAAAVMVEGALAGPEGQSALAIELQQPVRFTLHDGDFPSAMFSTRPTVGGALKALGADYNQYDLLSPPPETPLTAGMHVFVERATQVNLSVGGAEPAIVYTRAETVAELLAEREIVISGGDFVMPALAISLHDGVTVSVTVTGLEIEVVETPLAFDTIYRDDPELTQGESLLIQYGVNGYILSEYAVTYRNGEEVGRELVSEITVAPTDEIISLGTAPVAPSPPPAPAVSGDPDCARSLSVWATWYTAASAGGSGITATGTTVQKGTVAVDPSVIPLGTEMYIPGYGYGRAEDTGGGIIGNVIDLGYGPYDVVDWTTGYVTICILN